MAKITMVQITEAMYEGLVKDNARLEAELEVCRRKFMNLDAPVKELAAENQKLLDELSSKTCPVCGFPKHKFQEQALEDE